MYDQDTIKIDHCGGVFSNFDEDNVPPNHLKDALNLTFIPNRMFETRKGVQSSITRTNILRIVRYEIPGANDRLLILTTGNTLFDATASLVTPILTVSGMTDFSAVSLYGRAYISPHNGEEGLQDTAIYVYDPSVSATARIAAGDPPSDFDITVATLTPTVALADVASAQSFSNGVPLTLTTSPYVPPTSNTLKFTLVIGTGNFTAMTLTIVGKNAAFEATTEIYVNKVLASPATLTFTTAEMWSSITSITPSGIVGSVGTGTLKIEVTGKPPGKVERGYHVVAIAYESNSGYITRPGPAAGTGTNYAVFLVRVNKKALTISGWPTTLPTGMIKIHILISKAIVRNRYTGNPDDYQLFFVPATSGGIIDAPAGVPDATSRAINFFDADLVDSADFLKDNMSEIPAGVALVATSRGRLGIVGLNSTSVVGDVDEDDLDPLSNNTSLFISKGGEPESFSLTDGFVIVKPGGEGLRNVTEYRSLIYLHKPNRTYVTQDTGDVPSTWELNSVDDAIGAECHAIAKALGSDSATEDNLIVASRAGLQLFVGTYAERPLSWKIKEIWNSIRNDRFNEVEVALDPVNKMIYVAVPTDDAITGPNKIFMADYTEGLDWQNIKWCPWTLYRSAGGAVLRPTTIITQISTTGEALLRVGSLDGNVHDYDYVSDTVNDNTFPILQNFELYKSTFAEEGGISQFAGVRIKGEIIGTFTPVLRDNFDVTSYALPVQALTGSENYNIPFLANFVTEMASLKCTLTKISADPYMLISTIWIYGKELWKSRPA